MDDYAIRRFAEQFRRAIEKARDNGLFERDRFDRFPKGCCGETSYLLAEYLRSKGLECVCVSGDDYTRQTHAWLVIKDDRVNVITPCYYEYPDRIKTVYASYGNNEANKPIDISHYTESNLEAGLVVDITADQFGEKPVYVDYINDFYRRFAFLSAHDYECLGNDRLQRIYQAILSNLDESPY